MGSDSIDWTQQVEFDSQYLAYNRFRTLRKTHLVLAGKRERRSVEPDVA
jgi:hypothetical protein